MPSSSPSSSAASESCDSSLLSNKAVLRRACEGDQIGGVSSSTSGAASSCCASLTVSSAMFSASTACLATSAFIFSASVAISSVDCLTSSLFSGMTQEGRLNRLVGCCSASGSGAVTGSDATGAAASGSSFRLAAQTLQYVA